MLRFIKSFFKKQPELDVPTTAPYKVETPSQPTAPQCGCGRSSTGLCVGLHKLTAEEWAAHEDNPNKTAPVVVEAKKPAAKKAPAKKKPAAITAAPKKPRAKKPSAK